MKNEKEELVFVGGSHREPTAAEKEAMAQWLENGTVPESYMREESGSRIVTEAGKTPFPGWMVQAAAGWRN
jgi:hypothetical protein